MSIPPNGRDLHHDHQRSFSRYHLEKSPDGPESLLTRAWFSLSEPEQLGYALGDELALSCPATGSPQSPPRIGCRNPRPTPA